MTDLRSLGLAPRPPPAMEGPSPWALTPLLDPEPWREGVPADRQALIDRVFATATRGVGSFLDHLKFGRSDDEDRGYPFTPTTSLSAKAKSGGVIRVFTQPPRPRVEETEGDDNASSSTPSSQAKPSKPTRQPPPIIFGVYNVPTTVFAVDQFVGKNEARAEWDGFCRSADVKERYNIACVVVRQEFWPRLVFSGREQWLICAGRRLENGGSLFVACSLPDDDVPPCPGHLVRSHQLFAAHHVLPKATECGSNEPPHTSFFSTAKWAPPEPNDGKDVDGKEFTRAETSAALSPCSTMVSVAQIDLNNGMPGWVYYFIARQFARVVRNLRRAIIKNQPGDLRSVPEEMKKDK